VSYCFVVSLFLPETYFVFVLGDDLCYYDKDSRVSQKELQEQIGGVEF
jgi:hypothetical protein